MNAQGKQLPDLRKRESHALSAPNEEQPTELVWPELAVTARGSLRRPEQS